MASLLVAASILTYDKIKGKRAAKKDAKRMSYETRYSELEREHSLDQEKRVQAQLTGSNKGTDRIPPPMMTARTSASQLQPQGVSSDVPAGRRSTESDRASLHSRDGPSSWVDDMLREREKRGYLAQVDTAARSSLPPW
jgi:hypothetical protein